MYSFPRRVSRRSKLRNLAWGTLYAHFYRRSGDHVYASFRADQFCRRRDNRGKRKARGPSVARNESIFQSVIVHGRTISDIAAAHKLSAPRVQQIVQLVARSKRPDLFKGEKPPTVYTLRKVASWL